MGRIDEVRMEEVGQDTDEVIRQEIEVKIQLKTITSVELMT